MTTFIVVENVKIVLNCRNIMNTKLAKQTLHKIQTTPNQWDQDVYHSHCGTRHCFAGWVEILSGRANPRTNDDTYTDVAAREELETDQETSQYLFHTSRTLEELEEFIGATTPEQHKILKESIDF